MATRTRSKRLVFGGGLGLLLLWAGVQGLVVEEFALHRWRYGAFAMYSEPPPHVRVRVFVQRTPGGDPEDVTGALAIEPERRALAEARLIRGVLSEGEALALVSSARANFPGHEIITVRVTHEGIDGGAGRRWVTSRCDDLRSTPAATTWTACSPPR